MNQRTLSRRVPHEAMLPIREFRGDASRTISCRDMDLRCRSTRVGGPNYHTLPQGAVMASIPGIALAIANWPIGDDWV